MNNTINNIPNESDLDKFYDDLVEEISGWGWNQNVLPKFTKLTVKSNHTGNNDIRGGGPGELKLKVEDFVYTQDTPGGITFKSLTDGLYRMKGSKYDWAYEQYSGFKVLSTDDAHLVILADFGYGS